MKPNTYNDTWAQGDHVTMTLTVVDDVDAPIDITGWTLVARVGTRTAENVGAGTVTITNATDGEVTLEFATAVTSLLKPNQAYTYQLRRTDAGAEATLLTGDITVVNSLFI